MPDAQARALNDEMACFTCHLSWTTSCGGCHLPIEANWKTERHHYEGGDDAQLRDLQPAGRARRHVPARPRTARSRATSSRRSRSSLGAGAVVDQHQPRAHLRAAAADLGVRLFEPGVLAALPAHRAHDRDQDLHRLPRLGGRTTTTRSWRSSCCSAPTSSISSATMPGSARSSDIEAVRVTEWDEPQAVIGSYLHRYAYPDYYTAASRQRPRAAARRTATTRTTRSCLQLRGEYLYVAEGAGGMRVYDVASIANKGISERIITAPFSPLGQDTHIASTERDLRRAADQPADQSAAQRRRQRDARSRERFGEVMREDNEEQPMHPIYNYAFITDAEEGLILDQRQHAARRRAAQQLPDPRADLERGRHPQRRAPRHASPARISMSPPMPAWSSSTWTIRCIRR